MTALVVTDLSEGVRVGIGLRPPESFGSVDEPEQLGLVRKLGVAAAGGIAGPTED